MKNKQIKFVSIIIIVIVLVIGLGMFLDKPKGPGKYAVFAQCLKDAGAEFYGAFWCHNCQAQKDMFGSDKKLLNYIECSNPDQSQTQECIDKKIEAYPTWFFKDGSKEIGVLTMEKLAEKTACVLPQ